MAPQKVWIMERPLLEFAVVLADVLLLVFELFEVLLLEVLLELEVLLGLLLFDPGPMQTFGCSALLGAIAGAVLVFPFSHAVQVFGAL